MAMVMAHGNCSAPHSKAQPQTIPWGDRDANVTQGEHLRRVGLPSRCNPDMDMVEARGRQDWTVRLCGGKWTWPRNPSSPAHQKPEVLSRSRYVPRPQESSHVPGTLGNFQYYLPTYVSW